MPKQFRQNLKNIPQLYEVDKKLLQLMELLGEAFEKGNKTEIQRIFKMCHLVALKMDSAQKR